MPVLSLGVAKQAARYLVQALQPACDRIEIVGSVRREKPIVKDLELLVIPTIKRERQEFSQRDLFGDSHSSNVPEYRETNCLELRISRLMEAHSDRLALNWERPANGPKYKRCLFYADAETGGSVERIAIPLDLFIVLPPAQWAVLMAIRTGDAEFSRALVTPRGLGGLCPDHLTFCNGTILDRRTSEPIPVESEAELFAILGLPEWSPKIRDAQLVRDYLHAPKMDSITRSIPKSA